MNRRLNGRNMLFKVPDKYPSSGTEIFVDEDGVRYVSVAGTGWYTNLDVSVRHDFLDLRGNYYRSTDYLHYDNFDAIDVSKVENIPCDYEGLMGVPISFLDKFNPEQFEIIGMGTGDTAKEIGVTKNYRGRTDLAVTKNGKSSCPYTRIIIRNRNPEPRRYPDEN